MTPEQRLGNIEPELTEDEKVKLAKLEATEKAARLGGGDVCNPFANEEKDPGIDEIATAARNVY